MLTRTNSGHQLLRTRSGSDQKLDELPAIHRRAHGSDPNAMHLQARDGRGGKLQRDHTREGASSVAVHSPLRFRQAAPANHQHSPSPVEPDEEKLRAVVSGKQLQGLLRGHLSVSQVTYTARLLALACQCANNDGIC